MATQLQMTLEDLEQRVAQRTVELTEANILLEQEVAERQRAEEDTRQLNEELEERVRERTAELAASNEELEAFAYSVAHDLRAPLRSINGFSQILEEDYRDVLDLEGQQHLNRIAASSRRMGQLIDALLTLSRVIREDMSYTPVDLSGLAAEIVSELRRRDPERRVEVTIAEGMEVVGDANPLRVVLENLIGNAWKFSGTQPRATIEFSVTEVDGRRVFLVRDNGVGFDMAHASNLFGTFKRLHHAHEFEGTGIGLATVQRIVHRHRGRIWAESAVGEGAGFFFTLGDREGVSEVP